MVSRGRVGRTPRNEKVRSSAESGPEAIKAQLTAHAWEFCQQWLSNGYLFNETRARVWRCGDVYNTPPKAKGVSGSFHLCLDGEKAGEWFDFATGEGGHIIDVIIAQRRCEFKEAANVAAEWLGVDLTRIKESKPRPAMKEGERVPATKVIQPVPDDAMAYPKTLKYIVRGQDYGVPDIFYEYRDETGRLHYVICRFNKHADLKGIQMCFIEDHRGQKRWWWKGPVTNIPYNLQNYKPDEHPMVLIVEGEKCADAARQLLSKEKVFITTWRGGSNAVKKTTWDYLTGANIVIWPDNDEVGKKAAGNLKAILSEITDAVSVLAIPDGHADGWDIADAIESGWGVDEVLAFIKEQPITEPLRAEEPEPKDEIDVSDWPFICKGFDGGGKFWYMNRESQKFLKEPLRGHTKAFLFNLADRGWWMKAFPYKREGKIVGFNNDAALNCLMRVQQNVGMVDSVHQIGRGAWMHEGKVICHVGDKVVNSNKTMSLMDFNRESKTFADRRPNITNPFDVQPMQLQESTIILQVARMFSWSNPSSGLLAAGFLAVAPLAGLLPWRPHIWVTGAAQAGKSSLYEHYFKPILGNWILATRGSTSEAALRGQMEDDALPVLFDEAEAIAKGGKDRMKNILGLVRCASSNSEVGISKAARDGSISSYYPKCPFAFFSIDPAMEEAADISRITALELLSSKDEAKYAAIKKAWVAFQSPGFSARFLRRQIALWREIDESIRVFTAVCRTTFKGNSRAGDQYGALLGGAYMLKTNTPPTAQEAEEFIKSVDWSEQQEAVDVDDAEDLLFVFLTYQITDHKKRTRTVLDLWRDSEKSEAARQVLSANGFKRKKEDIIISTRHNVTNRIGRAHANSWTRILRRHPSITGTSQNSTHYIDGAAHKCVSISLYAIVTTDKYVGPDDHDTGYGDLLSKELPTQDTIEFQ